MLELITIMSYEFIQKRKQIPDFCGICPECRTRLTRYHDLKCATCDNQEVMWCPSCVTHIRFNIPEITFSFESYGDPSPVKAKRPHQRQRLPPHLSEDYD